MDKKQDLNCCCLDIYDPVHLGFNGVTQHIAMVLTMNKPYDFILYESETKVINTIRIRSK